jgi:hypothetical protein
MLQEARTVKVKMFRSTADLTMQTKDGKLFIKTKLKKSQLKV